MVRRAVDILMIPTQNSPTSLPSRASNGKTARSDFAIRPVPPEESIVTASGAQYRFTVLTEGLLRYEWAHDGCFEDRASTFVVHRDLPTPSFRVVQRGEKGLDIITSLFRLQYDKQRFTPGGLTVQVTADGFGRWRYGEPSESLGGTARTLDKADGRIPLEGGILGRRGFAAVDDSQTMLFDGHGWVTSRKSGDRIDGYLFAHGHDYKSAIRDFYKVAGSTPLLPRWTLGNWWSRYYPYQDIEYLELLDRFEKERIPFSVAVLDMDWHLVHDPRVQSAGSSGWTGYTWNDKLFPNPKDFLSELHKRDLRVTLNDHPADGVYSFEEVYYDMAKALDHDTSNLDPIPFDITDSTFADAFFDILHRRIEQQGLDFWWCDWQQGKNSLIPGFDPLWLLNHFSFLDNGRDHNRPLHFSRYAGPGSHRYPIGFSGDTIITWASLAFQPEFTATASNVGYGWWSNDIGGHMHGVRDEELHTRWVQLGVFSPIMRLHSTANIFLTKEPWNFSMEHEAIQKEFLRLRHRLVPYLYSMNVRATRGEPLIEPMYWSFPTRNEAYAVQNQFRFGTGLIVVPITSPADAHTKQASTQGWLPPGNYVDIFTETVYSGDRNVQFSRPLSRYPVLAPAGAILPLDAETLPQNGCPHVSRYEILIAVGEDGAFEIHEDDGQAVSSMKTRTIPVRYSQSAGRITIGPSQQLEGLPSTIDWNLRFLAFVPPAKVEYDVDGAHHVVDCRSSSGHNIISLGDQSVTSTITINIGAHAQMAQNNAHMMNQLFTTLSIAQIDNDLKARVWNEIKSEQDEGVIIQRIQGLGMDLGKAMVDVLLEPVLAYL